MDSSSFSLSPRQLRNPRFGALAFLQQQARRKTRFVLAHERTGTLEPTGSQLGERAVEQPRLFGERAADSWRARGRVGRCRRKVSL